MDLQRAGRGRVRDSRRRRRRGLRPRRRQGKRALAAFRRLFPGGPRRHRAAKAATLPSGDAVILAAAARREIECLEAATGRLRWRSAIDEPFVADPVVAGSDVLLAVSSGRLAVIDAATGESSGFVQLPLPLGVAPAVDARRKLVFQLADRDDLFALAMPGGRCRQVLFLGHAPGSVAAPPVLFGDCLLAAVNETTSDASLLVMKMKRTIRNRRPRRFGSRRPSVCAGTWTQRRRWRGRGRLWPRTPARSGYSSSAPPGASEPLREMAGARLEGDPSLVRFPLLQAGGCFIDDVRLTSFDIQSANQQVPPRGARDPMEPRPSRRWPSARTSFVSAPRRIWRASRSRRSARKKAISIGKPASPRRWSASRSLTAREAASSRRRRWARYSRLETRDFAAKVCSISRRRRRRPASVGPRPARPVVQTAPAC